MHGVLYITIILQQWQFLELYAGLSQQFFCHLWMRLVPTFELQRLVLQLLIRPVIGPVGSLHRIVAISVLSLLRLSYLQVHGAVAIEVVRRSPLERVREPVERCERLGVVL